MAELIEGRRRQRAEGPIRWRGVGDAVVGTPTMDVPDRLGQAFDVRIGEPPCDGKSVEVMRQPGGRLSHEIGHFQVARFGGVIDELPGHDVGHDVAHDGRHEVPFFADFTRRSGPDRTW